MMKKIFALFAALLLCVSISACGKAEPPSPAPTVAPTVEAAATEARAAEVQPEHDTAEADEPPVIELEGGDKIVFTLGDGSPVPGVRVQLCTDALCTLAESDSEGTVVCSLDGAVEAHIVSLPDGRTFSALTQAAEPGVAIVTLK